MEAALLKNCAGFCSNVEEYDANLDGTETIHILLVSFYILFSSFHGLVVCGSGLRTDSGITLFQPCSVDSFPIIIIII